MLARAEIGTKEHLKLWVGGKDPAEEFRWDNSQDCACGQYSREFHGADHRWHDAPVETALRQMNKIAQYTSPHTFGVLHAALIRDGW